MQDTLIKSCSYPLYLLGDLLLNFAAFCGDWSSGRSAKWRKMFPGFRSRWTMPKRCILRIAVSIYLTNGLASFSSKYVFFMALSLFLSPATAGVLMDVRRRNFKLLFLKV